MMAVMTMLASTYPEISRILRWPPGFLPHDVYTLHNPFPLSMGRSANRVGYHSHDYGTLYGKRDFADVIKVLYQPTLS